MNRTGTWTTRIAVTVGALGLVLAAGTGTASAAMHTAPGGGAALSSLVTAGTITAAQQTAVKNAIESAKTANKALGANALPCDQVKAAALASLVRAGTITSAQSSAITAAFAKAPKSTTAAPAASGVNS